MLTLSLIILIYIIGGFIDFWFKERTMQEVGWKKLPWIYHHPQWWVIIWTIMAAGFNAVYQFTGDWRVYLGVLLFQLEDIIYFTYKYIFYGKWLPDTLNYLDPLNIFNNHYTKYDFLMVFSLFLMLFILIYGGTL